MTTEQLKERYLGSSFKGRGQFKVGFTFRGKEYFTTTTNTMALDRIDDNEPERVYGAIYVTQKQALQSLYWEVKRSNNLN